MRVKKYNPRKALDKSLKELISRSLVVYFVTAENKGNDIILVNMEGDIIPVTPSIAKILESHRHKWSVMLGVFYKEKGAHNCSFLMAESQDCRVQHEMVEDLNREHQLFINKKQGMGVDVLGAGWVASPSGVDLSEQLCGNIFDKLGAFA